MRGLVDLKFCAGNLAQPVLSKRIDRGEPKRKSNPVDQQTKQALKHDQFVDTTKHGLEWATENRRSVILTSSILLAAILFPVFQHARENARKSSCLSNLKQLGLGFTQYLQDYDGRYPGAGEYQHWGSGGHWVAGTQERIVGRQFPHVDKRDASRRHCK